MSTRPAAALAVLLAAALLTPALAASGLHELRPARILVASADDDTLDLPHNLVATSPAGGIGPGALLLSTVDDDPASLIGCTANFVWRGASAYYLGAAGHCFLPSRANATHGSNADYDPSRTTVRVCVSECVFGGTIGKTLQGNTTTLGSLAYARQIDADAIFVVGHDFGVVRVPTALESLLRPTMPVWDGPTGAGDLQTGDSVCLYGNSRVFGETYPTKARSGIATGREAISWSAAIPAFQGDSGSAVVTCNALDANGLHGDLAVGIATHIGGDIVSGTTSARAVDLAREAGLELEVVPGEDGVPAPHRVE